MPTASVAAPIPDAERVIAGLRPAFRRCYRNGLIADPSIEGRVVVRVNIDSGTVREADVVLNTGLPASVAECIAVAIRRAQFTGTGTLSVPVSFVKNAK